MKSYEFGGNNTANVFLSKSEMKIRGFEINTSYTFTKSIVDFNDGGLPTDNNNLRLDRGATDDDRKHEINIDTQFTLYRLIKYKPLINTDVYLTFSGKSGLPYSITTGKDGNGDGVINDRPPGVKRNSEYGAWNYRTDLKVNWKPGFDDKNKGKFLSNINKISFSVSVENLFNRTNFQNYSGIQTSNFFNHPTSADSARNIKFGTTYLF